ncbi:hypothetical protein DFH06DRAFT_1406265 [Mycena polygramma]|nr:hypothetical protein DFH06DRAFT_1406265 [Mycena polygramma]
MAASNPSESSQFVMLKDCLARQPELDDFASYLAHEVWPTLPVAFREAAHDTRSNLLDDLDSISLDSTPVSCADTLISYGIASDVDASQMFLRKVLSDYLTDACAPPPVWSSTRAKECEICEREIPLTYHHLIPRSVHAKAMKKKWHPPSMLNSVAWLCRPCHTVVHHLAQNYYSVNLLLQRDDIQRWGKYSSKQRFGVRRG